MNNRILIIGGVILALLLILFLAMGGLRSDDEAGDGEDAKTGDPQALIEPAAPEEAALNFDHVWSEATTAYEPECDEGCTEILNRPQGTHGGSVRIGVRPDIDDPVAQWSDCVQSIMSCYEERLGADDFDGEQGRAMHDCVLSSACPAECRDHYQSTVGDNLEAVNAALDSVFLGERAACLPTEAWVE